jgi:hypothetical protein
VAARAERKEGRLRARRARDQERFASLRPVGQRGNRHGTRDTPYDEEAADQSVSIPCGARIASSQVVRPLNTPRPRNASQNSTRRSRLESRERKDSGGSRAAADCPCALS